MKVATTILIAASLLLTSSHLRAEPGQNEARAVVSKVLNRKATQADRLKLMVQANALATRYPSSHNVAYAQGRVLSALGRSQAALKAYERAISLNSGFADAHYNAGVVLTRLKRTKQALRRFILAGKFNPRMGDAFYNAAQVLYNQRKFAKAQLYWKKVLRLEPSSFGVTKKILQTQNALGQFGAAAKTHARLWRLQATSRNPRIRGMKSVAVDQFYSSGYHVLAYETFKPKGNLVYLYQFQLRKGKRGVGSVNLESSAILRERGLHSIIGISRASGHRTTRIVFRKRPSYRQLRHKVMGVIRRLK